MRAGAARVESSPIIAFVHDVQRRRTGAELSAASAFDLRAGFDADTIRIADVLALYPYENTLRAVRLSGAQLKAFLEWSARYFLVDAAGRIALNDSVPGYNFDMVDGAEYAIDLRQPLGERIQALTVRASRSSPATASPWPSTAIARRAQAATTCCAARPWSTTRASGFRTC